MSFDAERSSALRLCLCAFVLLASLHPTLAVQLPDGFSQQVVFDGMNRPTALRFAPDGRVFVIEKLGAVKVFSSLSDPTADLIVDLGPKVHAYLDRGLLGLEIDPNFPTRPYLYILYTFNYDNNEPGIPPPRWAQFSCPDPPGGEVDGCVVNARLARLEINAQNQLVGSELVLLENHWCQQFPSHSVGGLEFGPDGSLYVSAGDGANYLNVDFGQYGGSVGSPTPANPCGDPPSGRGGTQTPPTGEGGALRSQDLRTAGDAISFAGAILRVDPDTGEALPSNPLSGGDPGDDRVVAYGLRNPFRIAMRPGTNELWIGDVGWGQWEEIDRIPSTVSLPVENFGWPCYEGANPQPAYDGQNLTICENLYTDVVKPALPPYYAYNHDLAVDIGAGSFSCSKVGSSSVTGLLFYTGGKYPPTYQNALFFADYSRRCIYVMYPGPNGDPDLNTRRTFVDAASSPVDLQQGPDGLLYYVDFEGARIYRVSYNGNNQPPVAVAVSNRTNGPLPLTVQFDGTLSTDPDPDATLSYTWDLNADGTFGDGVGPVVNYTYTQAGQYLTTLKVTDQFGASSTANLTIIAGNSAPTATILDPPATLLWHVGQQIDFRGEALDPDQGLLPPAAFHWEVILWHCPDGPGNCHAHSLEVFDGVDRGSFLAPDHEWYAYLEMKLTVTDSGLPGGVGKLSDQASRPIDPQGVDVTFESDPSGFQMVIGPEQVTTPVTRRFIVNSAVGVSAISPQIAGGKQFSFIYWSNGGDATQTFRAPASNGTLRANYAYDQPTNHWWNLNWRRRIRIPINNSGSNEPLVQFPLLVALNPARIDYTKTQNAGQDARVVDADDTTLLAHEIDRWDETGRSLVWAKVPQIDAASSNDFVWLYYDNSGVSDGQSPSAVWSSDYRAVWHLSPSLTDSTVNANHGADNLSVDAPGWLGRGRQFSGNGWIQVNSSTSLSVTGQLTLEAWIKIDDPNRSAPMRIISKKQRADSTNGYELVYHPQQNQLALVSSGTDFATANNVDLDTNWHHIAATLQGTTARLYVDGIERTTDPICNLLTSAPQPVAIGRRSGTGDNFFGLLDEVRVSGVPRSTAWIKAQHLAMTDAYLSFNLPEDACGPNDRSCNGRDDDCDGSIDEDAVTPFPVVKLGMTKTSVNWSARLEATGYDVVRGSLGSLRSSGGNFTSATLGCLGNNVTTTSVPYTNTPAAGAGEWVLVRGVSCTGPGTYDEAQPGQQGARDAEINAAASACP